MKILIADDHSLIIDGFVTVIKSHDASIGCYTATNKNELFDVLATQEIDILFQDILFGTNDARGFIKQVKEKYPLLKVIVISTLSDKPTVEMLFKQGVNGYLVKSDGSQEIIRAIEAVMDDTKYISKELLTEGHSSSTLKSNAIILTPREKEILCLILKEKTTKEIAEEVCLSEKTVENHRANLFIKFGVKNLAGLVKQAILEGFL